MATLLMNPMNPRFHRRGLALTLLATIAGCSTAPNSTAGCNEQPSVEVAFDMLPDPPEGVDWSLAEMRAGIEGIHRGQLHPIDDWYDEAEDVDPDLFTPIVVEARLLPNAELIEYEDGPGPKYDCSVQDIVLYANIELRLEGGDLLGSAQKVSLYVRTDDSATGGSFFVPPNAAMENMLGEGAAPLPDSIQIIVNFNFDPDFQFDPLLRMSGLDETGSTQPLAKARLDEHEPLDE